MKTSKPRRVGTYHGAIHAHVKPGDSGSPIGIPAGPHKRGGKMHAHVKSAAVPGRSYGMKRRKHG